MHFATLVILASTLVLRSGDRITVEGPLTEHDGVVIFRSAGALYSLPLSEVDEVATKAANASQLGEQEPKPRHIKVSPAERERLLKDLEQNHSGTPAPEQEWENAPLPETAPVNDAEEWRWRNDARAYEESLRQAKENLELLLQRAERLKAEIKGLFSLGFKPGSFTYQSTQLAYVEEAIPGAELAVERAQRAWDQFRDDARRQGVLPGWLR
ncbi:MAG TPA: hypothetical protein VF980_10765 [Thermoanaerobaculia bacterium]